MAKSCLRRGCITPLVILLILLALIFGAVAFVPFASTVGLADKELFNGETFRTLGVEQKSIGELLTGKINTLGRVGSVELIEGLSLNKIGLGEASIFDIATKNISKMGDLENYDFSEFLLKGVDTSETETTDGVDFEQMLKNITGLTLKSMGLSEVKLYDVFTKKIGALGTLGATNLIGFIPEGSLPYGITHEQLPLKIGELFISQNGGKTAVNDLTLLDFVQNVQNIEISMPMIDEQTILDNIDDSFKNIDWEAELTGGNAAIGGAFDENDENTYPKTAGGAPIASKQPDSTVLIDWAKVFSDGIVFAERKQLVFKDTELAAIFNSVIGGSEQQYPDLFKLEAKIIQMVMTKKPSDNRLWLKTTVAIKTSKFDLVDIDPMVLRMANLPDVLYFSVESIVSADAAGKLSAVTSSVRIENVIEGISKLLLSAKVHEDDSLEFYIGGLVKDLFTDFMNHLGDTGTLISDVETLGSAGFETEHSIKLITRTQPIAP
jgi:hypothetical protein